MAEIERALELDPFNSFFQSTFGLHLLFLRRYDDTIAQSQKVLRTEPNMPFEHGKLSTAFHQKGMHEEELVETKKRFAVLGYHEVVEALDRGYAQDACPGAWRLAAEKLVAHSKLTYVPPTLVAESYAYAGEKDRALDWFEKAYQERDSQLVYINVAPDLDPLRSDPRFQSLLRRMNFPE